MKKVYFYILIGILMLFSFAGCSSKEEASEDDGQYYLYYMNKNGVRLEKEEVDLDDGTVNAMVAEFISLLEKEADDVNFRKAKPDNLKIKSYSMENGLLSIYFDADYYEMSNVREIFCRAAIVKTMTQIEDVVGVSFYVSDQPLVDKAGNPVGIMTKDAFIDDADKNMKSYQKASLTLFFASSDGTKLMEEDREVLYTSNTSIEKLVIDQLMKGPNDEELLRTIPENANLISVSTKDGTCFVNFDEKFLDAIPGIAETIQIYSIVNSLSELPNINKVQFTINGSSTGVLRENISLDAPFERNLDLVEIRKQTESVETSSTVTVTESNNAIINDSMIDQKTPVSSEASVQEEGETVTDQEETEP